MPSSKRLVLRYTLHPTLQQPAQLAQPPMDSTRHQSLVLLFQGFTAQTPHLVIARTIDPSLIRCNADNRPRCPLLTIIFRDRGSDWVDRGFAYCFFFCKTVFSTHRLKRPNTDFLSAPEEPMGDDLCRPWRRRRFSPLCTCTAFEPRGDCVLLFYALNAVHHAKKVSTSSPSRARHFIP
jgi:hypothetical protein